jgi:hypothetical protein
VIDVHALGEGERAAFHGRPADGIAPLAALLAQPTAVDRDQALRARWLLGVCQGAAGLFGSASATLQPLLTLPAAPSPSDVHYAGEGACVLASIHRQVGRFDEATAFDQWADHIAGSDPVLAFTAAVGLAADAVGAHDRQTAMSHITRASQMCESTPHWWRERIRLGWVQAEVDLCWDRPADAVAAVSRSVAESEQVGAPRHLAKSLSFLAVAQHAVGDPSAPATLGRAALLAESLGTWPLVWATRGLLAVWLQANPVEAERNRQSAQHAISIIAGDLPQALRTQWLARADVAPMLRPTGWPATAQAGAAVTTNPA